MQKTWSKFYFCISLTLALSFLVSVKTYSQGAGSAQDEVAMSRVRPALMDEFDRQIQSGSWVSGVLNDLINKIDQLSSEGKIDPEKKTPDQLLEEGLEVLNQENSRVAAQFNSIVLQAKHALGRSLEPKEVNLLWKFYSKTFLGLLKTPEGFNFVKFSRENFQNQMELLIKMDATSEKGALPTIFRDYFFLAPEESVDPNRKPDGASEAAQIIQSIQEANGTPLLIDEVFKQLWPVNRIELKVINLQGVKTKTRLPISKLKNILLIFLSEKPSSKDNFWKDVRSADIRLNMREVFFYYQQFLERLRQLRWDLSKNGGRNNPVAKPEGSYPPSSDISIATPSKPASKVIDPGPQSVRVNGFVPPTEIPSLIFIEKTGQNPLGLSPFEISTAALDAATKKFDKIVSNTRGPSPNLGEDKSDSIRALTVFVANGTTMALKNKYAREDPEFWKEIQPLFFSPDNISLFRVFAATLKKEIPQNEMFSKHFLNFLKKAQFTLSSRNFPKLLRQNASTYFDIYRWILAGLAAGASNEKELRQMLAQIMLPESVQKILSLAQENGSAVFDKNGQITPFWRSWWDEPDGLTIKGSELPPEEWLKRISDDVIRAKCNTLIRRLAPDYRLH